MKPLELLTNCHILLGERVHSLHHGSKRVHEPQNVKNYRASSVARLHGSSRGCDASYETLPKLLKPPVSSSVKWDNSS